MSVPTAEPEVPVTPAANESPAAKPPFESWGRYPKYNARVIPLHWQSDFPAVMAGSHESVLPVGMGRSYGDVCFRKNSPKFMQGRQTHHRIANPGRRAYDDAFDLIRHDIAQG